MLKKNHLGKIKEVAGLTFQKKCFCNFFMSNETEKVYRKMKEIIVIF
jgi:hypothetical protein